MDAVLVVLAVVGVAIAFVALVFLRREQAGARRSDRERAAEHEQVWTRLDVSEESRRAADLALASMEEGVLLFGADGATRLANPAVEEVSIDARVARVYAEIVVSLREIGMPLPVNDIWIGACAATTGASVLTCDGHFRHIRRIGSIILS